MAEQLTAKLIGEERGKLMGLRVVMHEGTTPELEASSQAQGKTLGVESRSVSTWLSTVRPDGTLSGKGDGISTLADGSMAHLYGEGTGVQKKPFGPQSWRGTAVIRFGTGKFAGHQGKPLLFEVDVDEEGNTIERLFEVP